MKKKSFIVHTPEQFANWEHSDQNVDWPGLCGEQAVSTVRKQGLSILPVAGELVSGSRTPTLGSSSSLAYGFQRPKREMTQLV